MGLAKQDFYEGAAIYLLARTGLVTSISYDGTYFLLNQRVSVRLKYCTRPRSPWNFTFTSDEHSDICARAKRIHTVVGLICGSDGVAAISCDDLTALSNDEDAYRISCRRLHREHYEVSGPMKTLEQKVAPSDWLHILESGTTR
jgi:hypothetical protein